MQEHIHLLAVIHTLELQLAVQRGCGLTMETPPSPPPFPALRVLSDLSPLPAVTVNWGCRAAIGPATEWA